MCRSTVKKYNILEKNVKICTLSPVIKTMLATRPEHTKINNLKHFNTRVKCKVLMMFELLKAMAPAL